MFIIRSAKSRATGEARLTQNEMMLAMVTWRSYLEDKDFIDDVIGKYDADRNGIISEPELKAMLTDLNDGEDVDDGDVSIVFQQADFNKDESISRVEIKCAIAMWYALVDEDDEAGVGSCACVLL